MLTRCKKLTSFRAGYCVRYSLEWTDWTIYSFCYCISAPYTLLERHLNYFWVIEKSTQFHTAYKRTTFQDIWLWVTTERMPHNIHTSSATQTPPLARIISYAFLTKSLGYCTIPPLPCKYQRNLYRVRKKSLQYPINNFNLCSLRTCTFD